MGWDESGNDAEAKREETPGGHRASADVEAVPMPFRGKLPLEVQKRILEHLLIFPGNVVHALSRFDPDCPPYPGREPPVPDREELPRNQSGQHALPRRFHIGDGPVSLHYATMPNILLAPLLVCKWWCFLGTHIFYGRNTFAFSSLGE